MGSLQMPAANNNQISKSSSTSKLSNFFSRAKQKISLKSVGRSSSEEEKYNQDRSNGNNSFPIAGSGGGFRTQAANSSEIQIHSDSCYNIKQNGLRPSTFHTNTIPPSRSTVPSNNYANVYNQPKGILKKNSVQNIGAPIAQSMTVLSGQDFRQPSHSASNYNQSRSNQSPHINTAGKP